MSHLSFLKLLHIDNAFERAQIKGLVTSAAEQ